MRVFVTGAGGYLGSALCGRLVARGDEVTGLVRAEAKGAALADAGVRVVVGDVTERTSLREGMSGADWVVHAAAVVDPRAPDELMHRVNEGGSRNVASLARKLGVGRVLAISSVAAFGGSADDGRPAREEAPRRPSPTAYGASKRAGEEAMREEVRRGLRLNVVWPALVYGPPGKSSGANSLLRSLARGGFPFLVGADRLASFVFVDDVVDAMVRVIERAPVGRDFLLAGEVSTIGELARRVCTLAGRRPPGLAVPVGVARLLLAAARPLVHLSGRRLPVSPAMLRNLSRHWAFDDARAREELAWQPRGLDAGLASTLAAFGVAGRAA